MTKCSECRFSELTALLDGTKIYECHATKTIEFLEEWIAEEDSIGCDLFADLRDDITD